MSRDKEQYRHRDRGTERDRDRERNRDRKTQTQRHRETKTKVQRETHRESESQKQEEKRLDFRPSEMFRILLMVIISQAIHIRTQQFLCSHICHLLHKVYLKNIVI